MSGSKGEPRARPHNALDHWGKRHRWGPLQDRHGQSTARAESSCDHPLPLWLLKGEPPPARVGSEGTRTGPVAEVGAAMRHVEVDRAGAVGVAEDLRQRLQHEACARVRHHLAPMR